MVTRHHRMGFPVLPTIPLCMHASATTPVGSLGVVVHLPQRRRPSPKFRRVGSHITLFEACSAFTHVLAYMLAEPPEAALCTEGFDSFVTSTAASIATGWNDQLPGGNLNHWEAPPFHGAP